MLFLQDVMSSPKILPLAFNFVAFSSFLPLWNYSSLLAYRNKKNMNNCYYTARSTKPEPQPYTDIKTRSSKNLLSSLLLLNNIWDLPEIQAEFQLSSSSKCNRSHRWGQKRFHLPETAVAPDSYQCRAIVCHLVPKSPFINTINDWALPPRPFLIYTCWE